MSIVFFKSKTINSRNPFEQLKECLERIFFIYYLRNPKPVGHSLVDTNQKYRDFWKNKLIYRGTCTGVDYITVLRCLNGRKTKIEILFKTYNFCLPTGYTKFHPCIASKTAAQYTTGAYILTSLWFVHIWSSKKYLQAISNVTLYTAQLEGYNHTNIRLSSLHAHNRRLNV